jgi:hypothetical protein
MHRPLLALFATLSIALLLIGPTLRAEPPAGFTALFDGKSIEGWKVNGGTATYKVEDGTIVGTTTEGSPNTFLCTPREYGDFVLEFDVKCDVALNSGVQVRSHVYEKETEVFDGEKSKGKRRAGVVYGYQCEIASRASGVSGNFYDEGRRGRWLENSISTRNTDNEPFLDNEWNHYRIVAQGDTLRSWINGTACAEIHDKTDATGFIGLQVHGIKKETGPYSVRWKNLYLRELKPGESVE